ncbi:hypothetical protein [Nocardia sp. NPDC005978]|uniref:hypothetical protein n=1 Tax=unclassified Nocardia TaxID=2637762 RepID=UPI0033BD3BBC
MTDIAPLAAFARAKFGDPGVHAIVRNGRTVHAVELGKWIGAEEVPELLCRTGVAGWSPSALQPTRAGVTCVRCLRSLNTDIEAMSPQLSLFGRDWQSGQLTLGPDFPEPVPVADIPADDPDPDESPRATPAFEDIPFPELDTDPSLF